MSEEILKYIIAVDRDCCPEYDLSKDILKAIADTGYSDLNLQEEQAEDKVVYELYMTRKMTDKEISTIKSSFAGTEIYLGAENGLVHVKAAEKKSKEMLKVNEFIEKAKQKKAEKKSLDDKL